MVVWNKTEAFLARHENLILFALLAVFILVNSQGLSWGLPSQWHPDELAGVVQKTLEGGEKFDTTNFDYPSLPKYFMLFLGMLTNALGQPYGTFFLTARFFSVILGGMAVWLAYGLARQLGAQRTGSLLAALLTFTSSEVSLHAHFAHNDLYATFFVGTAVYFILHYRATSGAGWLYAAFLACGLAASSKYNAGVVVLAALLAYALTRGRTLWREPLHSFETLFVGAGLSLLGYGIGTPAFITRMAQYLKGLLPALSHHASYGRSEDSVTGLIGQWRMMGNAWGEGLYLLFLAALLAGLVLLVLAAFKRLPAGFELPPDRLAVVICAVVALDLPILISYNYQARFLLPMFPLLAALLGALIDTLARRLESIWRAALITACLGVVVWSGMRSASVILEINHDARIPAGAYITTELAHNARLEYTFYLPNFNRLSFVAAEPYPLVFIKQADMQLPTGGKYPYNTGAAGVEERMPRYLVIDSFIYERFKNKNICQLHAADCDFFTRLLAGQAGYHLIADFAYHPPAWLPDLHPAFINPQIRVFERDRGQ